MRFFQFSRAVTMLHAVDVSLYSYARTATPKLWWDLTRPCPHATEHIIKGKEVSISASSSTHIFKAYQCFAPGLPFWGHACHPRVRQVREAAEKAEFAVERGALIEECLEECRADPPTLGHMSMAEQHYSKGVLMQMMEGVAADFNRKAGDEKGQAVPTAPKEAMLEFVLASKTSRTEPVLWVAEVGAYVVASEAKAYDDSVRKAHAQACVFSSPLHRILYSSRSFGDVSTLLLGQIEYMALAGVPGLGGWCAAPVATRVKGGRLRGVRVRVRRRHHSGAGELPAAWPVWTQVGWLMSSKL